MHFNVGSWPSRVPIPKVQIIIWRGWKGVRWRSWGDAAIGKILRGSLLLGFVELRFWRRPTLTIKADYP